MGSIGRARAAPSAWKGSRCDRLSRLCPMSFDPKPWQLERPTPGDFAVVVQTVPWRSRALSATLQSLDESDVEAVHVVSQQSHQDKQQNLVSALTVLLNSGKTWGIRLEDDVRVNRHLLHNVASWTALREDNFGAGWLYQSGALAGHPTGMDRSARGNLYRDRPDLVGILGAVFYVPMIPFVVMGLRRVWAETNGAQDKAVSRAIWKRALRVYVHEPPLVEHNVEHPSTLAPDRPVDFMLHTTGGQFSADWRRDVEGQNAR